mgnify:CR=1 FL=1
MIYNNKKDFLSNCKTNTRLIGLDVGTKTIGIALSDKSRIIATPKFVLRRKGNKKDIELLLPYFEENLVGGIIIGKPLNSNGEETECSKFIGRFVDELMKFTELPIFFVDETLTSFQAEDFLINDMGSKCKDVKQIVDKVAASYILQDFINLR